MSTTKKAASQKLTKAEKKRKALELKKAGLSYRQVADRLGISTTSAHRYIAEALSELTKQNAELAQEYRMLQLERYEYLLTTLQTQIAKGNLGAIEKARRICDSITNLMGAAAPTKIASTTPDGEEQAPQGVVVVPAVAGSVEEWLQEYGPKESNE